MATKFSEIFRFARSPANPNAKVPARKASTSPGTTYTADGIAPTPPSASAESGSSRGINIIELVPELTSAYSRTVTYTHMMNDAGVDVSMRVAKTPILGAEFYVDPYSSDPVDVQVAQFIEANLFGGMASPFLTALEDILHFFEDGYAVLEKVYELRPWTTPGKGRNTKQYTMLKKLGVRPPSTINNIVYDNNGGPKQLTQNAIQADNSVASKQLNIENILIFTFSRKGGDLTGKSLLRTAYPHWYYKTHLYKVDAVQKERHAIGVPRGTVGPGATEADKAALRTALANIRSNEENFIIQTPNVTIDFAELHHSPVDVLHSAGHHNMMLLLNVMAAFLGLGLEGTSGGGRAVGASQQDLMMKSLKYIANYICEVINMYLIPELVVWNFKTNNFPQMQVRNIGETRDLQMFGAAVSNLFSQSAITPDIATENFLRRAFDMPEKSEGEYQPEVPTRESIQAQINNALTGNGNNGNSGPQPNGQGSVKGSNGNAGQGNTGKPPGSVN